MCRSWSDDGFVSYKIDRQYTSKSGSLGCEWCGLIARLAEESKSIVPLEFQDDTDTNIVRFGKRFLPEDFTPKGNNRYGININGASFYLTATATEDNPISAVVTARPAHSDVTSDYTFQSIDQWLDLCATHPDCGPLNDSPLPTRLIEVSPADNNGNPRIALTKGKRGKYVALSYCWGGRQEGMTRKNNISTRLQGLDSMELSNSILQAIDTTRRMGLRYIWIDAICIIQDDEQDKAYEISQMCDIYRQAFLTIVAANSARAIDGFLKNPSVSGPRPYRIPFWTTDGRLSLVCLQLEGWYNDDNEPINSRCWTLQERLLSRRLVIYASHNVQVQCQYEIVNLDNSLNIAAGLGTWRLPSGLISPLAGVSADDLAPEAIMELWKRVITQYSARQLKRVEERLVALAGLAHAFREVLQLPYLAGLWSGPTLPLMLLWEAAEDTKEPYQIFVAPSWSWASISTPVSYRNAHKLADIRPFDVEILSATMQLQNAILPLGKVSGGRIVLRGHLQPAKMVPPGDLVWTNYTGPPPARPPIPSEGIYAGDFVLPDIQTYARLDEEMGVMKETLAVMCLALAVRSYDHEGAHYDAVDGILIQKTKNLQGTMEFRRIGSFYGAMQEEFVDSIKEEVTLV